MWSMSDWDGSRNQRRNTRLKEGSSTTVKRNRVDPSFLLPPQIEVESTSVLLTFKEGTTYSVNPGSNLVMVCILTRRVRRHKYGTSNTVYLYSGLPLSPQIDVFDLELTPSRP